MDPGTKQVAPLSAVKSSTHHAALAPWGSAGHGVGTKIWSACSTISPPPGPVMLADRLPSSIGQPNTDLSRRSATGCSARSANTGDRLSTFHTRWFVSSCSSSSPNLRSRPRERSWAAAWYRSSCTARSTSPDSTPVTAQMPWVARSRSARSTSSVGAGRCVVVVVVIGRASVRSSRVIVARPARGRRSGVSPRTARARAGSPRSRGSRRRSPSRPPGSSSRPSSHRGPRSRRERRRCRRRRS